MLLVEDERRPDERQRGAALLLRVELLRGQGEGLYPDLLSLGLTALADDFRKSLTRVWESSGLANQGFRGRWRILRYPPANIPAAFALLSGRSMEAAMCCALWAAAARAPGELREPLSLDFQAAVSARLDGGTGKAMCLGEVHGIPAKLRAARQTELAMVLLAPGYEEAQVAEHHRKLGRKDDPIPLKTIGEAFERLLEVNLTIRRKNEREIRRWQDQWISLN